MKPAVLESDLSEEEQTLLGLLKISDKVRDINMFNNLVYIAEELNCIPRFYEFRVDYPYTPFSSDLYCVTRILEERDYIDKNSFTLTEKGEKWARQHLIKKEFKKINRFSKPETIIGIAQVAYLYDKLHKRDILREPVFLFSTKSSKIEKIFNFLSQFKGVRN